MGNVILPMVDTITTIDMSPVGTAITTAFKENLPAISTVAGILIGAAVVYRWIKRASRG